MKKLSIGLIQTCGAVVLGLWLGMPTSDRPVDAGGDSTPPTLTSFSFAPTTINTSSSTATVTVTAHLKDSPAGVCISSCSSQSQVRFRHNGSTQIETDIFSLKSGTLNDGNFEAVLVFPQFSATGTWEVDYLLKSDRVGNYEWLQANDLTALGFPVQLTITQGPTPTKSPTPSPTPTATPDYTDQANGDLNCDGSIDSYDALVILRHSAELTVDLPAGCRPIGAPNP